jgi:transcriptional regulator with XRE-family HTH domain
MTQAEPGPSRGSERLQKWLEREDMPDSEFGALVGVDASHIGRLRRGSRRPGLMLAREIEKATAHAVCANQWLEEMRT